MHKIQHIETHGCDHVSVTSEMEFGEHMWSLPLLRYSKSKREAEREKEDEMERSEVCNRGNGL